MYIKNESRKHHAYDQPNISVKDTVITYQSCLPHNNTSHSMASLSARHCKRPYRSPANILSSTTYQSLTVVLD